MADTVAMVTTGGMVEQVPAAEVRERELQGFRVATAEEAQQDYLERKHAGIAGTAAAVAGGVAAGIPGVLPATVAVGEALGDEGIRQTAAELQQAHPGAWGAGEVVGTLGTALGTGGVLGRVGQVAGAPGAVIRGGVATEGALGGGLLGLTARGAVEGAGFGASQAWNESVIHDTDLTGEKLLAAMGHGAALGGGLTLGVGGAVKLAGATMRGAGSVAQRALTTTSEGIEAVAKGRFGYVPKGLAKAWSKASGAVGQKGADALETLGRFDDVGREARRIAVGADDIIARQADDFAANMSKAHDTVEMVGDRFKGIPKKNEIGKVVRTGNEVETASASKSMVADVRSELEHMKDSAAFSSKRMNKLLKKVTNVEDELAAAGRGDVRVFNRDAMMAQDRLKRDVGRQARAYSKMRNKTSDEEASWTALDRMYERLRAHLERDDLWGGAADIQRNMNGPWSSLIEAGRFINYKNAFTDSVAKPGGRIGEEITRVSRKKVGAFLDGLTNPNESEALSGLNEYLDAMDNFVAAGRKNMALDAADRHFVEEMGGHLDALRGGIDEITEAATLRNQLKVLSEGSDAAGVLGGIGGAYVGGPLGAVGGVALGAVLSPGRTIRSIAAVESLTSRVGDRLADGTGKAFARATARGGLTLGRVASQLHDNFTDSVQSVQKLDASRDKVEEDLRMAASELSHGAPQTVDSAVAAQMRAIDVLLDAAPSTQPRGLMDGPTVPSAFEMSVYGAKQRAVEDPLSLVDDLSSGFVDPDAVEAVRQVYPALYQDMQRQVMEEAMEASEDGRMLPYQDVINVSVLAGMPMDSTMEPESIYFTQQLYAKPPEQAPGVQMPKPSGDLAEQFQSGPGGPVDDRSY